MTKISNQYSLTNILTADLANSRLGINNVSPTVALDVTGAGKFSGALTGTTASFSGNGNFGSQPLQSWGSIFKAIQIGVSGSIVAATSATETDIALYSNTYYDGTNYKILNSTTQVPSYFQLGDGTLSLATGNTGAVGSNVTGLSTKFLVTKTGIVGIGTTFTPYGIVSIKSNATTAYAGLNVFATGNGNFTYLNHDNNVGIIGTEFASGGTGSTPLTFQTGGAERMRILANGNVLIANTIYTADRLSVEGTANNWTGKFVGSTTSTQSFGIDIVAGTSSADYPLYVRTTNFSLRLYVRGDGVCYIGASSWVYNSDRRVKENISDVVNGLDLVSKLKPKYFDYINGAKNNLGFIAQEVQELIPQAVTISDEKTGMLGLKTDFIVPYLTKAIQELSAENTSLINRIEALENK